MPKKQKIITTILILATLLVPNAMSLHADQPPETIDTLSYFIGDHLDKGLTGSHNQNQTVIGNVSYYTKWASDAYEVHSWDSNYIYLKEDGSWKKDESYAFNPGKWMKRQMQVGESITESGNVGYYVNSNTCVSLRTESLPYSMTLEAHISDYNAGGDLGTEDVIVLKYDYSNAAHPGNFERFYYSKEWGWIKWELYENNTEIQESVFNQIHSSPIEPDITKSCTESGTKLPANIIAGPSLKLRLNEAVRVEGSTDIYYINRQADRQYICDDAVLQRYGTRESDVEVIPREELQLYPAAQYVRFVGDNNAYKINGELVQRLSDRAIKNAKLNIDNLAVYTYADFSCYRVGPTIFE